MERNTRYQHRRFLKTYPLHSAGRGKENAWEKHRHKFAERHHSEHLPDVAQSDTEAEHREEELDWTVPGDPGGGVAALALHVLLHLVHLLELNHSAETRQQERLDVRKKQEKMNGNFREW